MPLKIHWTILVKIHWASDNPLDNASGLTRAGSPDCRIAGLPDRRIAGLPDCRIAGSPDHQITGSPDYRIAGLLDHRIAGLRPSVRRIHLVGRDSDPGAYGQSQGEPLVQHYLSNAGFLQNWRIIYQITVIPLTRRNKHYIGLDDML